MTGRERDQLIDGLLDGDLTDVDFLRLEAEMIVSEDARRAYYERQKLDLNLGLEANEGGMGVESPESGMGIGRGRSGYRMKGITAVALVLLMILIGFLGWKIGEDARADVEPDERIVSGFGVLATDSEAEWGEDRRIKVGDLLVEGGLHLVSGTAKLEFFNGVDVVLSGCCRFHVGSDSEFRLESGKAFFRVPDELDGVTVEMPSGEVFDFGTEFALEVGARFETVEVLSGSVGWRIEGREETRIEAGRGLRRTSDGSVETLAAAMLSMAEIESSLALDLDQRKSEWERKRERLCREKRVIAWYSMEQAGEGGLSIRELSGREGGGDLIRCSPARDRWGNPLGAVDFSLTGSRVRVQVDDSSRSLTLMCWVRIDSLDRRFNSLFLTDGHEQFEPHWQIMDDGRLFFSVKAMEGATGPDKHIAYSPPIWDPSRAGQWMHLSTVFDRDARTITHYVNGVAVSLDLVPEALLPSRVQIGAASIGNWSEPRYRKTPEFTMRNLNGAMDELILFSAPLSGGEIEDFYQSGKP